MSALIMVTITPAEIDPAVQDRDRGVERSRGADASPVAQQSMTIPAADSEVSPTPPELDDLALIADTEGVSLDEAIRRFGWQTAFGAAVSAVEERHPTLFAGSSMQTEGPLGATIEFAGAIPADVADLVRNVPVPVTITGDARLSEAEVRQAVSAAHYAARAEPSTGLVSTEYADETGEIVVTLYGPPATAAGRAAEVASVERAAANAVAAEVAEVPVRVNFEPERGAGSEAIRGGAILNRPGSTGLSCTSGWPVVSTDSGLQGLITAEHCRNDLNYSGRNVLTYRNKVPDQYGDIQAMSSTEFVSREYYYGVGKYRKVYGRGRPREDQYLCKFGRATGRTCDRVRRLTSCRGDYCNLVSMDRRTSRPGDSGGPWGYGRTAHGVHSGWHTAFGGQRSQWTPIDSTMIYMRVRLKKVYR